MRGIISWGLLATTLALAACGGSDEPDEREEPMKVEDTVFAPVVTAPARVQDRANAAVDLHRERMNERLERDEGEGDEEAPPGD
ncbi:MAG TPA: hypothetical protein VFR77_00165 [Steroidobacteraceae bacterium]|nr:hypothetical protein [Steroidobacteraceae bacterium]